MNMQLGQIVYAMAEAGKKDIGTDQEGCVMKITEAVYGLCISSTKAWKDQMHAIMLQQNHS